MKLTVTSLAAERGGRAVFDGVSFAAGAGRLLRVTGANGAGKTTLLRILGGLAAPAAGEVQWRAEDATLAPAQAASYVGHANAFNDALTVRENLAYAAALAGLDDSRQGIESALTALGVRNLLNRRFGTLSQGQRKRASLARLLAGSAGGSASPRAWLLDEPFVALDVDTQAQLAAVIAARLAAGGLVIYTSHQAVDIAAARTEELAL
jgi:heme exporter protein A